VRLFPAGPYQALDATFLGDERVAVLTHSYGLVVLDRASGR
jgi:hypothetical protein